MPRLLGIDIPNDKPTTDLADMLIRGVGSKVSHELCRKACVDPAAGASGRGRAGAMGTAGQRLLRSRADCAAVQQNIAHVDIAAAAAIGHRKGCRSAASARTNALHAQDAKSQSPAKGRKGPSLTSW
jgi:ribosomal protein S13